MNEQTSEFLEQLMERYRHCDTYQDTGIIQVDSLIGERRSKSLYSFSTFFVRPCRLSLSFWFTDDPNSSSINIVYSNGEVRAYREGSGVAAVQFRSLNEALSRIRSMCSLATDGFDLAIPALLERELRDSSEANFFDVDCTLVEQLNSKFHLRKTGNSRVTDIWFRPDLTVHDVEVCSETTKEELIDLHRKACALPEMRETMELTDKADPLFMERFEEHACDTTTKSRRVYSHVIFDLDIDDSVFDFPTG